MTKRSEINTFIENLTTRGNHREHVRNFCQSFPLWNPITQQMDENIEEDA
ncbi:Uncharacterised protein [uncultured archaeon]|nr:Uncharacterised protein [uncultured archaeon]